MPDNNPPRPLSAKELAEIIEDDAGTELAAVALQELVGRASGGSCMYTLSEVREMGWVPPGLVGLSKEDACQVLGWGDFSACSPAQQQLFARLAERLGVKQRKVEASEPSLIAGYEKLEQALREETEQWKAENRARREAESLIATREAERDDALRAVRELRSIGGPWLAAALRERLDAAEAQAVVYRQALERIRRTPTMTEVDDIAQAALAAVVVEQPPRVETGSSHNFKAGDESEIRRSGGEQL